MYFSLDKSGGTWRTWKQGWKASLDIVVAVWDLLTQNVHAPCLRCSVPPEDRQLAVVSGGSLRAPELGMVFVSPAVRKIQSCSLQHLVCRRTTVRIPCTTQHSTVACTAHRAEHTLVVLVFYRRLGLSHSKKPLNNSLSEI